MNQNFSNWLTPQPVNVPQVFLDSIGGYRLVSETLIRRGIQTIDHARAFLYPELYSPTSPLQLPDLEKGVGRLVNAIKNHEKIGIWGDFDVDGQTATALLVSTFRTLGVDPLYHIPIRARESHGINIPYLQEMINQGIQVLLTCDTGITAHDAVEYASQKGIDTIITDHHVLPESLPPAYAVINPQRLPIGHPLSYLCGVGTAYKLAECLLESYNRSDTLNSLLDLVTLGTIADIAVLLEDNRWIVQQGLDQFRENPRLSIKTILEIAEVEPKHLTERHLGFVLGPRLNALGRLGDANPLVDFLISDNPSKVKELAEKLEGLNNQRKFQCDQVFQAAQSQVKNNRSVLDYPILILENPEWPAGILGIVASRLVDLYHLPVILLSTPPGQPARGSARSVDGVHITNMLTSTSNLLNGYGGHMMAAGLSLPSENIPELRRALSRSISLLSQEKPSITELTIDAELRLDEIKPDLVQDLERLAPFGPGNPSLVMMSPGLNFLHASPIGKTREHLQVFVEDTETGHEQRIMWWQGARTELPEGRFDLAYTVRSSNYRGLPQIQIEWVASRPHKSDQIDLTPSSKVEVIDKRMSQDPLEELDKILSQGNVLVWAEGTPQGFPPSVDRFGLKPYPHMVIFTIPPGRSELLSGLDVASPQKITFFAQDYSDKELYTFLSKLAGYLQHALKVLEGRVSISKLASLTSQRELTIRKGIQWFISRGDLSLEEETKDTIRLSRKGKPDPTVQKALENSLASLFDETSAYRKYYQRAEVDKLIERNPNK